VNLRSERVVANSKLRREHLHTSNVAHARAGHRDAQNSRHICNIPQLLRALVRCALMPDPTSALCVSSCTFVLVKRDISNIPQLLRALVRCALMPDPTSALCVSSCTFVPVKQVNCVQTIPLGAAGDRLASCSGRRRQRRASACKQRACAAPPV
jgi:hypothetical protein